MAGEGWGEAWAKKEEARPKKMARGALEAGGKVWWTPTALKAQGFTLSRGVRAVITCVV